MGSSSKFGMLIVVGLVIFGNFNTLGDLTVNSRSTSNTDFHDILYSNIDAVTSIAPDNNSLWYGTTGGLVRYYPELEVRLVYTTVDGLPASKINDVAVDPYRNYVWVATGNGIGFYDKRTTGWQSLAAVSDDGFDEAATWEADFTAIAVGLENVWLGNTKNELFRLEFGVNNKILEPTRFKMVDWPDNNIVNEI